MLNSTLAPPEKILDSTLESMKLKSPSGLDETSVEM